MDEVWDRTCETYRPQTYSRCQDLFREFTFLDLEERTDPVVYLERLERLQAEIEELEAVMKDELSSVVSSWACLLSTMSSDNDFSGKKLVRENWSLRCPPIVFGIELCKSFIIFVHYVF